MKLSNLPTINKIGLIIAIAIGLFALTIATINFFSL